MESRFRKLPKDILLKTALDLDLPDILSLCKSDEKINEKLCESENNLFWIEKLQKDFYVNYNKLKIIESPKNVYFNLNADFNDGLQQIFDEGYPEKLKNQLINSGYIKKFQNEITKVLGPYYGEKIDEEKYDNLMYNGDENVNEILQNYFFGGGEDRGYYPLQDADTKFADVFEIKYW